ncbi:hypothetical protein RESH_03216 [Rhodopirellula europaea SH398]|uniref:Uncharacterized protein n=1 Tax=Rhodopirellula europaea SH398 TaxID=1263868 RepID=M5S3S4_9BACT|nr:hypothetical protein RESH_03216 [Rhodopirellula europaea SH398]
MDAAKAADKTFAKRGRMVFVIRWGRGGNAAVRQIQRIGESTWKEPV